MASSWPPRVWRAPVARTSPSSNAGTRCPTTLSLHKGDVLSVREIGGPFETRAQIVNTYLGNDRVRRLNLKFLDARSPSHLLRSH